MKIGHTKWQTISEENKDKGEIIFGYEAPASEELLRKIQKNGILIEVVGKNTSRLIRPENQDRQHFAPDQKFHIMEQNKTFPLFEKKLTGITGNALPENRFDEFIKWTNPKVYRKTPKGYQLSLNRLSDDKKLELQENLQEFFPILKDNHLSISGKKNMELLEFTWKMSRGQGLKNRLRKSLLLTNPSLVKKNEKEGI